jgi:hypothetical protein
MFRWLVRFAQSSTERISSSAVMRSGFLGRGKGRPIATRLALPLALGSLAGCSCVEHSRVTGAGSAGRCGVHPANAPDACPRLRVEVRLDRVGIAVALWL